MNPFIFSIWGKNHFVVDNDVLMRADSNSEALLMLMCCYFVYNFRYSEHVLPTLLSLQSQCLGLKNEVIPKSSSVATLVKMVEKFKKDNGKS